MPCAVTMKDSLVVEVVDENYAELLAKLIQCTGQGVAFMSLDDMEGTHVMFNIPNITVVKEMDS